MSRRRPLPLALKTALSFLAVNLLAGALIVVPFHLAFWNNIAHRYEPEFLDPIKTRLQRFWREEGSDPRLLEEAGELLAQKQFRFIAFDDSGRIIAATAGVTAPFQTRGHGWFEEFFSTPATESRPTLYGISKRKGAITIQLATSDAAFFYEAFIDRLMGQLAVIGGVFLVVTLGLNLLILRRSLRPLRRVSEEAAAIGPQTASRRLSDQEVPVEVLPLVSAVNSVLDRLEEGYVAQRGFIADAAHELRTPLAVLKAHLDVLDDRETARSLEGDLAGMERLVSQLLSMARLDGIQMQTHSPIDLSVLTVEAARRLGPLAFARDREIEVVGAEAPVWVRGQEDALFRALRNLVENALRHGPIGSTITLQVADSPPSITVEDRGPGIPLHLREAVFQRFWRGDRDRSGEDGAGLGLAIAAAAMKLHGGTVEIGDTPGGGAAVTLCFRSETQSDA